MKRSQRVFAPLPTVVGLGVVALGGLYISSGELIYGACLIAIVVGGVGIRWLRRRGSASAVGDETQAGHVNLLGFAIGFGIGSCFLLALGGSAVAGIREGPLGIAFLWMLVGTGLGYLALRLFELDRTRRTVPQLVSSQIAHAYPARLPGLKGLLRRQVLLVTSADELMVFRASLHKPDLCWSAEYRDLLECEIEGTEARFRTKGSQISVTAIPPLGASRLAHFVEERQLGNGGSGRV
jgi:hypothetical protein